MSKNLRKSEFPFERVPPNHNILLYHGRCEITFGKTTVSVDHFELTYDWFPEIGVKFFLQTRDYAKDLLTFVIEESDPSISFKFDEFNTNKGLITSIIDNNGVVSVNGICKPIISEGDISIGVNQIKFAIPNLNYLRTDEVFSYSIGSKKGSSKGALSLQVKDFRIILYPTDESNEKIRSLQAGGGYAITYVGEIVHEKSRPIYFKDTEEIFPLLSCFLSFYAGRLIYPILPSGWCDEKIWTSYTVNNSDSYYDVARWSKNITIDFRQYFEEFKSLRSSQHSWQVLATSVRWYCESIKKHILIETSIMLLQANIELLYNYLIVEEIQLIKGGDAINISAANKIRLLISQIDSLKEKNFVTCSELENLNGLDANSKDTSDDFVFIRNAVVHGNLEKRISMEALSENTLEQGAQFARYIVEMAILRVTNYQGSAFHRLQC